MKISIRPLAYRWGRRLQRLYASAIRRGTPPKRGGTPGGSLAQRVLEQSLLSVRRWGVVYTPSQLGNAFRFWWRGTSRQAARGQEIPIDEDLLERELTDHVARQIRRADRS